MTYPTLEDKVNIIKNTLPVARACGVECPKVAPLAAVEVVNPKMPVTLDAAELTCLLYTSPSPRDLVYKAIVHMVKVKNGCILTGTKVPVILTSRSDTFETKVNSIALAAVVAEEMKKNQQ